MSFIATPLYLHWLGVEAYGLVGFYLLLQGVTGFFSAGLTDAANREIAAQEALGGEQVLAKWAGFGRAAWLLGLTLGLAVAAGSGWLATHWLTLDRVSIASARHAILLMAALLALQVPLDFYVGALLGSRRHVPANLVLAGTATIRAGAGVLGLALWAPTAEVFFWSQLLASLAMVLVCEGSLRPAGAGWRGAAPWSSLRASFRFSAGMTAVAFTGMILSQADKVVLSRALRLEEFGLYSLATTLANLLYFLIGPVQAAYYPEFTRRVAPAQVEPLTALYHQACQRMAVLVMPAGAVLLFFARDLLALWTARPDFAEKAAPVVMFLVGARLIGAVNTMPYTLQFAHGWTSLVVKSNLAAVVLFVPLLYLLAMREGAVGAAAGYFLLSLPFLGVIVWRMHRRLLPGELGRWLWRDTLPPLVLALGVAGAWRLLQPAGLAPAGRWLWLALASAFTLGLVVLANPATRGQVAALWRPRKLE